MSEEVKVSDDLTIITYGKGELEIHSIQGNHVVGVLPAELPALLRELETTAQGMGVETGQGEMVKACNRARELLANLKFYNNIDSVMTEPQRGEYAQVQLQLGQALAKAEAK